MMDNPENPKRLAFFRVGTPQCGLITGLLGAVLAFLFLFLGFWNTLFVIAFFGGGFFLGAFTHKVEWLKKAINRMFPPRGE